MKMRENFLILQLACEYVVDSVIFVGNINVFHSHFRFNKVNMSIKHDIHCPIVSYGV